MQDGLLLDSWMNCKFKGGYLRKAIWAVSVSRIFGRSAAAAMLRSELAFSCLLEPRFCISGTPSSRALCAGEMSIVPWYVDVGIKLRH